MTIRVLLVEDDRRVHDVVGKLLESIGDLRPVSTVTTEAEANLWLEENPHGWDLAVIDRCSVQMPLLVGRGKGGGAEQLPVAGH